MNNYCKLIHIKTTPYKGKSRNFFWNTTRGGIDFRSGLEKPYRKLNNAPHYSESIMETNRKIQVGDTVYTMPVNSSSTTDFAIVLSISDSHCFLALKYRGEKTSVDHPLFIFRKLSSLVLVSNSLLPSNDRASIQDNKLGLETQKEIDFLEKLIMQTVLYSLNANIDRGKRFSFSEDNMIYIHKVMFSGLYHWGGKIRTNEIVVGPMENPTIEPYLIKEDLRALFLSMQKYQNNLDTEEKLINALVHINVQLCWIHPFTDGNGRVIRLMSEFFVQEYNYKIIWSRKKKEYHSAIRKAVPQKDNQDCNTKPLARLFKRIITKL